VGVTMKVAAHVDVKVRRHVFLPTQDERLRAKLETSIDARLTTAAIEDIMCPLSKALIPSRANN